MCRREPSEYTRGGNIFFPVEDGETLVGPVADFLGHDQLFYASDFPHWDNSYPHSITELEERGDFPAGLKRKVLAENTERLYAITP